MYPTGMSVCRDLHGFMEATVGSSPNMTIWEAAVAFLEVQPASRLLCGASSDRGERGGGEGGSGIGLATLVWCRSLF